MATFRVTAALQALLLFLAQPVLTARGSDSPVDAAKISALIQAVTSKDPKQIAPLIQYPFARDYPVPSIKSASECLKRFSEVFDETLLTDIAGSDPKHDWERVGWRGIMLGNGEVWLDEDYKIIAINHETEAGKAVRVKLIAKQKERLPAALRDFDKPVLECSTEHFLIRVDLKGDDYRLLVFKGHSYKHLLHMKSHGHFEFDGSGGNSHIDWVSGGRSFRLINQIIGEGGPEYTFQEFAGGLNGLGSYDPPPLIEETGDERVR